MQECSRSDVGVAGPAPTPRTWGLNSETGSTQCPLGKVPLHNWTRTTLPAQSEWVCAGSHQKPAPFLQASRRQEDAAPPA
jgi:hypothetical protein